MKRLLPLLLLFIMPIANAQLACTGNWFLSADATVKDVTCTSAGTPVGSIVLGANVTALTTDTDHATMGIGFSDYTTDAMITGNTEEGQTTTDTCSMHSGSNAMRWISPGACLGRRSGTMSTITDGSRFTPNDSTTLYGGIVMNLHTNDCHVFSAGQGTTTDNTFSVTHGLGATPNFGVFAYTDAHDGQTTHAHISIGLFNDNGGSHVQKAVAYSWQNAQSDSLGRAQLFSDYSGAKISDAAGTVEEAVELTANNSTSTTFTARLNDLEGDLVGILCYEPDKSVWVGNVDSPDTDSSTWTESTANFQPEFMLMLMTNLEAEDTMYNDDERAGNIGVFLTDFSNEYSQSVADENGATPTDSQSRQDTKLYLADHDGTSDYDMSSVTATSTGFQVTSANITTADTTTHLWPTILVGTSSSAAPLRRRR